MSWKAINRRTVSILLGYNLPFLLWTAWTGFLALSGLHPAWPCPVRTLFHFCPACGLTGSYVKLLSGGSPSLLLLLVLALFVLNSAWSFHLVFRRPRSPAP